MWIVLSATLGGVGVILGAFGAHALRARLQPAQLETWSTAVEYHLIHAAVLVALALYARATGAGVTTPCALLGAGILLFSGSLYLLALGGPRWLGPVTPLGGLCFIAGWGALAWHGWSSAP